MCVCVYTTVYYAETCAEKLKKTVDRLCLIRPSGTVMYDASGSATHVVHGLVGWYPIALSGINISKLLVDELHIRLTDHKVIGHLGIAGLFHSSQTLAAVAVARDYKSFWNLLTDHDAFQKLFALCMLVLDSIYMTDNSLTVNDFYA